MPKSAGVMPIGPPRAGVTANASQSGKSCMAIRSDRERSRHRMENSCYAGAEATDILKRLPAAETLFPGTSPYESGGRCCIEHVFFWNETSREYCDSGKTGYI